MDPGPITRRSFSSVAGTGGVESVPEVTEIDGVFAHDRVSSVFTCADSSFALTGGHSQV